LGFNVVFVVVRRVHKGEFAGEVHVGFVEGDEEEGEDLMDIDEEDAGFLVEFCLGWGGLVLALSGGINDDDRMGRKYRHIRP
jgi:hypothetical protein